MNQGKLYLLQGLLISAFGPYFAFGGRFDHFVVFIGAFLVFMYWVYKDRKLNSLHQISLLLLLAVCVCIFADFFSDNAKDRVVPYWHVVGRLLYPGVLGFSLATLFSIATITRQVIEKILISFLWLSLLASLLAIGSKFFFIPSVIELYAGANKNGLWYELYSLNRLTGIFTQPLEAGAFYSLVLFVAIYLWNIKRINTLSFLCSILFLSLGGVACFSKVYLILGLGLGGLLGVLLFQKRLWKFISFYIPIVILTWTISFYFLDPRFKKVYSESVRNDGVVAGITAGRLGAGESGVKFLVKTYVREGVISGLGIGRYMPLDNGYLEYALQGGVVALLLYLFYLLFVFFKGVMSFILPEGKLLVVVSIFMGMASLGGPVLTANRVNIFLLVLISSCFVLIDIGKRESSLSVGEGVAKG